VRALLVLPGPLAAEAGGEAQVEIVAARATVAAALQELFARHPRLRLRVLDETGRLRPHVNVFVGGESIRFARGLETPVPDGSEIVVLPAVSGG
jgi:MoaD family protein